MEKVCSLPLSFSQDQRTAGFLSQDQRTAGLLPRESLNAGDWQVKMAE